MTRRKFFEAASATSATLALSLVPGKANAPAGKDQNLFGAATNASGGPVAMPATIAMGSGAPLGGIGTGFLELRPDGCFYEWQILNFGPWAGRRAQPRLNDASAPNLRFLLWTAKPEAKSQQLRRLYLRSNENDLYSLGYAQDIQGIDYEAWFPMTTLHYRDNTLPLRVSATAFSPFIPGKTRDSATPGFHITFTLENISSETVQASLLSVLDNPLAAGLENRQLRNTVHRDGDSTNLLFETDAQPQEKADLGSLSLSVTGGDHSWISGTFQQFTLPGMCEWRNRRVSAMLVDILQDFFKTGRLPNTSAEHDPADEFKLGNTEIDALSTDQLKDWLRQLSGDALFNRVISEARAADPAVADTDGEMKLLLKEIARNLSDRLAGSDRGSSSWGTGALASSITLKPGEKVEVRFTLGWFFPHHINKRGEELGHMYANWFGSAAEVNEFLLKNYAFHRDSTEGFARTLADTSLGTPLSFVWSSQLGTLVKNTWWTKDSHYSIWEGLGCCGQSTTDVDFDGSGSIIALFPELKLGQMRDIIRFQNELGQVPHNYSDGFDRIDRGGYGRVDMNPQFVMMVCRDYLWTGDKDYLNDLWPAVVKAMDYTGSLDTNGDGLPDQNCGFQTYDQWRMSGAPSYIASLWIGALRAGIRLARETGNSAVEQRWRALLDKASASFDHVLFNGEYYSLWVDGERRDEICMSDQVAGEWFSRLMGLAPTISEKNLSRAIDSIWKNNFSSETGLRNATAPRAGLDGPVTDNHQAGGVWSGIEFAFASFLMDSGRFASGAQLVEAVYRRYLRAGMPWTHVECGSHYTRAMSSWATLLAATGFKPDLPVQLLAIAPGAPGDFHAPWVMASGFGSVIRKGGVLTINCRAGALEFKKLRLKIPRKNPVIRLSGRVIAAKATQEDGVTTLDFAQPISIQAGQSCTIE